MEETNTRLQNLIISTLMLFIAILAFATLNKVTAIKRSFYAKLVYAESEDSSEHEDDNKSGDDSSKNTDTTTTIQSVDIPVETAPPIRYVTVVDPGFDVDTDKDGLVDALDPDPTIPQQDFFRDDDGDGIANAFDKYPGQNDFIFVPFQDDNHNGIADSLEQ